MNKLGFIVLALAVVCVMAEPPRTQRFRQQRGKGRFFARQEVAPESDNGATPYQANGFKPDVAFELPGEQEEEQNDEAIADEQDQEAEAVPEQGDEAAAEEADAPYPAAGAPAGRLLRLPIRKAFRKSARQEAPSTSYGAPSNSYGPPATEYGVPAVNSAGVDDVVADEPALDEEELADEPESENVDLTNVQAERLRVRSRSRSRARSGRLVAKKQQKAAYVQLPSGQYQRVVYLTPAAAAARSSKLRRF